MDTDRKGGPVFQGPILDFPMGGRLDYSAPWQFLYFFSDPQGQGLLRGTRPQVAGSWGFASAF